MSTRDRILDAALTSFGTRGFESTSLDDLAVDLGIRKQSILYYFASKDVLLGAVVDRTIAELGGVLEAALLRGERGWPRIEEVVRAVFRLASRQPAFLGLLREVNRMGPEVADELATRMGSLVSRAVHFLAADMKAGLLRQADPRFTLFFVYSTVVGTATDPAARTAMGVPGGIAGLRQLRRELLGFLRASLVVNPVT